ncbi:Protein of unknown function [Gemmobacter aquatilis]|uniref:ATP-dependent transcriptional regulator n=1 Tax=Gemmobacter aquatilis TaxID=933059 RepID=A0A1H8B7V2_9RHOB|nr:DUF2927 domain-containing protein [Gemmobacter aquatilis]SEM78912.1 Protein of unknown function [Gemmobacter aquatilis]
MRIPAAFAFAALSACVQPGVPRDAAQVSMLRNPEAVALPLAAGAARSNTRIAQDFLDLEFQLENGRRLPVFTRFTGPITVALAGDVPATAPQDLAQLLARMRQEAGIDITPVTSNGRITVTFLPRRTIRATHANVACFVVPGVSDWAGFQASPSRATDWSSLRDRDRAAIFAPSDASPQEVRDCLHEELAQAIGPLNDLYRLPDSVFNDDNFQTVLTGFDMLMLRLHNAPALHSGLTRAEVDARLPALLAQINPQGGAVNPAALRADGAETPRAWTTAIETAFAQEGGGGVRRAAAQRALTIAQTQGWRDSRLAFSWFAVGRLTLTRDPQTAAAAFAEAERLYHALPGAAPQRAHVDMQLAALALSQGQLAHAIAFADRALPVARASQNATLMATLLLLKAQALEAGGNAAAARALRLDSQPWARYGFGSDAVAEERLRDIAGLVPPSLRLAQK